MTTRIEEFLCYVLDCGTVDISILNNINDDLEEILESLRINGTKITLEAVVSEVFHRGIDALNEKIEDRIRDCEYGLETCEDAELEEFLTEQIELLNKLDVYEDIDYYFNYLDTSIYFVKNSEIYLRYLEEAISDIEDVMGFEIMS